MSRIVIMGNGAWGNALAKVCERAGHDVAIWSRRAPDAQALANAEAAIVAVGAQDVASLLASVQLPGACALIITAKGIDQNTSQFMHEVAKANAPSHQAYLLSGPSFAADVLKGLPTAVTLAGPDMARAMFWALRLSLSNFRLYGTDDMLGVAIGGAMKNVLAIACGIAAGAGLGDSARAALVTRGFAELVRFGHALGARPETLMGLSGFGDLMLTASSDASRNYSFGRKLGAGMTAQEALAAVPGVVEGAATAKVAVGLCEKHGVDMPIVSAVHAIIDKNSPYRVEMERLLARPLAAERQS